MPFFLACTNAAEEAYMVLMWSIRGLPLLFVGALGNFLLIRVVLRRQWGNVFLLLLLTHVASQASANLLKMAVHRQHFCGAHLAAGVTEVVGLVNRARRSSLIT